MWIRKYFDRLQRMNALIDKKATGTPDEFAGKLGIKRSTLFQILQEMRDMDLDIKYSCSRRSYFYANGKRLQISVKTEPDYSNPV